MKLADRVPMIRGVKSLIFEYFEGSFNFLRVRFEGLW
jgi:hypothetical protein